MKTVIVFDLDDTLYDEMTYVRSGFQAVADHLQQAYGLDAGEIFRQMCGILATDGRGRVFDHLLERYELFSARNVKKCLSVYRNHIPQIKLSEEGARCLQRLKNHPLYIVTDGNKLVQHNKLKALGLYGKVNHCFITHRHGIKHAKPSPYCFEKITAWEKCLPQQVVYVGDNPQKDFKGIRPLGFKTVRVKQGQHQNVTVPPEEEAQYMILSLDELDEEYIRSICAEASD